MLTCVYVAFDPFHSGMPGWRSGESTHLQPIWPEFNSQSHMWTEFFGSLLCTERFSPVFPLLKKPTFDLVSVNCYFQFIVSPISAPALERLDTVSFCIKSAV